MMRDSAYAKRARTIVVNNVVGSGVGMQAQVMTTRSELASASTPRSRPSGASGWPAELPHGRRAALQRPRARGMAQVFEAGEVFIRKHYSRFGDSDVPLALELIEPSASPTTSSPGARRPATRSAWASSATVRPRVAYWIRERHPGDIALRVGTPSDRYERVPASDIFHLRIVDRWPQTRGEPWLHTVLRKIDEMNEYTGSEVQSAARAASYYFATIKSAEATPCRTRKKTTARR
jgi:capsid protein